MARPSITQLPPTGLDRFRGFLTRADDLTGGLLAAVPGIGTLAALNRSGNAAQAGNYTKAVESLTDVVPVGRLATRAIKGLTKGRSTGDVGGVLNIRAPQQDALDLAQKRAALPVSEGGLGLPENNTPMDRARAMGYTGNWYHGTNKDIRAFNPDAGEAAREKTGTNLSSSPEVSNTYAGRPDGNVMPLMVRTKGFDEVDFEGNNWNRLPADAVLRQKNGDESVSDFFDTSYDDVSTNDIGRLSRSLGAPGLLINDVADRGGYVRGVGEVPKTADNMMVFDPSRIRSRFAAFDPFRFGENDLLAFRGNMASSNLLNINPLLGLLDYENQ